MNIDFPRHFDERDRARVLHGPRAIINQSFIETADEDYVVARALALNKSHRAFYWPALQCLEKYLKAALLFFGQPVRRFGHDIVVMSKVLSDHSGVLEKLVLNPLERHEPLAASLDWGATDVHSFIEHVYSNGLPSNRYNMFGVRSHYSALLKLDQVVYALRNHLGCKAPLYGVKKGHPFEALAYEENLLIAPAGWSHGSVWGKFGQRESVPEIEIALKGHSGPQEFYVKWLKAHIQIHDDEIKRLSKETLDADGC